MEALPGLWSLSPLGALIGLLVLSFILLTRGALVPRASHERELAAERNRAEEWKAIAEQRGLANQALTEQVTQMLEVGRTVQAVLRSAGPPGFEETSPSTSGSR